MLQLVLAESVQDDLEDVWMDIFQLSKSTEFADSFVDSFIPAFERIAKNPGIGEPRDYLIKGFRKWTHRKYIIYYSSGEDWVRIERILWGPRQQLPR